MPRGPPRAGLVEKLPVIGGVRVQSNDDTRARLNKQLTVAGVLPFVMGEFIGTRSARSSCWYQAKLASRSVTVTEKWCIAVMPGAASSLMSGSFCPFPSGCSFCESSTPPAAMAFGVGPAGQPACAAACQHPTLPGSVRAFVRSMAANASRSLWSRTVANNAGPAKMVVGSGQRPDQTDGPEVAIWVRSDRHI